VPRASTRLTTNLHLSAQEIALPQRRWIRAIPVGAIPRAPTPRQPCALTASANPRQPAASARQRVKRRRRVQAIARGGRTPGQNDSKTIANPGGVAEFTRNNSVAPPELKNVGMDVFPGLPPRAIICPPLRGLTRLSRPSGCGLTRCGRSGDRPYRDCAYHSPLSYSLLFTSYLREALTCAPWALFVY
jgi:hypothetical protein